MLKEVLLELGRGVLRAMRRGVKREAMLWTSQRSR